jgi:hypothetical protein
MFQPLIITREHNHLPEPEKQVRYETTAKAKEAAKISGEKPKTIIDNVYSQASTSAGADLVRPENLQQIIKRLRKSDVKTGHWETVHDIELIEELTKTIENELFLWADTGKDDPERTLVFSTTHFYDKLNDFETWYFDGTFDVVPRMFKQMVTINVIHRGKCIPILYALLTNKSEKIYTKLLKLIFENENSNIQIVAPKFFMVDFEKAIVNSVEKYFPATTVKLCYFHFTQSMWRNVQKKGLVDDFS